MSRTRIHRSGVVAAGVVGAVFAAGACGTDRRFDDSPRGFDLDASIDAPDCRYQCSLDGRSVIKACTGEVVEMCPPELACGEAKCQEPCAAAAADRSSNGCEYYFQIPRLGTAVPQSCYAAYIVNTSTQPVTVDLELDGKALDFSKSIFSSAPGSTALVKHEGPIAPGDSAILFVYDRDPNVPRAGGSDLFHIDCPVGAVPVVYAEATLLGSGIGSSFHLKTSAPVGATAIYPFGGAGSYTPSATLLLPVATWAKEHMIVNAWPLGLSGLPGVQIFASEDDTDVTIVGTHDIQNGEGVVGGPAHVPMTYHLAKGRQLQLVQSEELTGSIVTSTKPTTIVGANSCGNIREYTGACDVLAQQIPAFEQWGSEYVGVGYRPRSGNPHEAVPYRIVAARDGTRLDYDPVLPPGAPLTMSAGEVATFHSGTDDAFVVRTQDAEHPIYMGAYMSGGDGDYATGKSLGGRGDPEFVNVVPAGQYLSSYTFFADQTYAETSLVIVRAKTGGEFKDVWLECAGNVPDFKPVGTRGAYEYVRVDLSRNYRSGSTFDGGGVCKTGTQRMRSDGPFTATLWGWDQYASYAYPGGMAVRKLVKTALSPVR